jgi:two-component system sensor histidine kinase KdpD
VTRWIRTLGRLALVGLVCFITLVGATLAVAILEGELGVPDASAVYFVAVVGAAVLAGTGGAVTSAVAAFLVYNFLFVDPRHTFTVADPGEWLKLVLLLFVAIVVGQLAAVQRQAAKRAQSGEREALAQFRISRALATRETMISALTTVAELLRAEAGLSRVWITLGADDAQERSAADTGVAPLPSTSIHSTLQRMPGDVPARWRRVHAPGRRWRRGEGSLVRVRIEAGDAMLGSIWGVRVPGAGLPGRTETRLLSAAADQIGQVITLDRLATRAQEAEIARQSDALKSALLQSVSHDLRTPLATIRAAAGTLQPGNDLSDDERAESAAAIDREVEYLDRLVTNLLDLSRIEAGNLRAERDVFELDDLIGRTIERLRPLLAGRRLEVDLGSPPVKVDPVFLDEVVTNTLDNAIKHTPPETTIRMWAVPLEGGTLTRLRIEDDGPGVPSAVRSRIFDKFYRVPGARGGSRSGTGIGLAVVRGLVEAMGGRVAARRSSMGGLAIDIDLPTATVPADVVARDGA